MRLLGGIGSPNVGKLEAKANVKGLIKALGHRAHPEIREELDQHD